MLGKGLFITGTDTDVGKTYVAEVLIRALRAKGYTVAAMKPVASGCVWQNGMWINADAMSLGNASSLDLPYTLINPFAFEPAIAPHIAAQQAGVSIDLEVIVQCYHSIAAQADYVVVEGAGGWLVPLNAHDRMADIAKQLALPVLMVSAVRLGWINHSFLTAESIAHSGCRLNAMVANNCGRAILPFYSENLEVIKGRIQTRNVLELAHGSKELVLETHQNLESLF